MDFFRLTIALTAGFIISTQAHAAAPAAADPLIGIRAALSAREKVITEVSTTDDRSSAQRALNNLVREGVRALRSNGDRDLATRYENEWEQRFSNFLTAESLDELGDHTPLSQWLANFYIKLEERLGRAAVRNGVLGDIWSMNYAIPVVFKPNGEWRTTVNPDTDWVEYRKHFIPFANVVTYWGSLAACNYAMSKQGAGKPGKELCKKVALKLREVMGRTIAPKISDYVFARANRRAAELVLTAEDLVYLSAEELLRDIQAHANQTGGAL